MSDTQHPPAPAGRTVEEWARDAGICRATVYTLDDESQPRAVKIGKRRIIIEPAADWLARMAKRGGATMRRRMPEAA